MNLLARPSEWIRSEARSDSGTPFAGGQQHYVAFLSYSHRDAELAKWLHNQLENFKVPKQLVGRITEHGAIPRRLTPIFRDLGELPASDDLGQEIKEALTASRFQIVLCSPAAAKSRWTNAEIEVFKRVRPEGCVLAAIVAGEPFMSEVPGREAEECLPKALRFKYDRRGRPTTKRAEPLAADLRETGEARRIGFLKLVAGMLGVGLDDLVQRDTVRRQQRMAILAACSLLGMVLTSGLAVTAIQARDAARDQRREAEGLVSFMLGDLKEKLEPIGRLDALDGVGGKVLDYYGMKDAAQLSDGSLMQRSRALALMAGVADSRGNLDGALRLYGEAMAGTAEAVRRQPNDPERLFDHAQNVFYVSEIELRRGNMQRAEAGLQSYARLAARMIAREPDNMKYRMEVQYAATNLGVLMLNQRRFDESSRQFERALRTIDAISTADPGNADYQKSLVETLAWAADANSAAGRLDASIAERERQVNLLQRLFVSSGGDVSFGEKLIPARRTLGWLYSARDRLDPAIEQSRLALRTAQQLLLVEPTNSKWRMSLASTRLMLAGQLLERGQAREAASEVEGACGLADALFAKDPSVSDWQKGRRDCLVSRAEFALALKENSSAVEFATRAVAASRSIKSSDSIEDEYGLAKAFRLLGDARQAAGDPKGAHASWADALSALPETTAEAPAEMYERRMILDRLGRREEARQLAQRLTAIGFRDFGKKENG